MVWGMVAMGAASLGGAYLANQGAKKTAQAASAASAKELAFAKEQYQDWLDAFGDIQTNLSQYYDSITPDYLEAQGLQAFEQERTRAMEQLNIDLEQRGIATSGIAAGLERDVAVASAEERARIRANAPLEAAKQKREFLQIGLGQNPAGNVQQVLSNQAGRLDTQAQNAANAAGAATGAAIDTTFDALSQILNDNAQKNKAPTGDGQ